MSVALGTGKWTLNGKKVELVHRSEKGAQSADLDVRRHRNHDQRGHLRCYALVGLIIIGIHWLMLPNSATPRHPQSYGS